MQLRIGRPRHDVLRHLLRVGDDRGERGRRGDDRVRCHRVLRDRLHPLRAVTVEERRLFGRHDLLEDRDALVELEAAVLGHIAQLSPGDAAIGVLPLHEVVEAHVHGDAGEREDAGDRLRRADDDVASALGRCARNDVRREHGGGGEPLQQVTAIDPGHVFLPGGSWFVAGRDASSRSERP